MDVKNDGGYVIGPPSVTQGKYVWCDEDLPFASAPEWLRRIDPVQYAMPEGEIPQGQQDDVLYRFACALRHKGFSKEMVASALRVAVDEKCVQDSKDPFTDKDIGRWVDGAFKHPTAEAEDKSSIVIEPVTVLDFKGKDIPPIEYYVDGILQKQGRLMISSKANMGKSFFLINMLAQVCGSYDGMFLGNFQVSESRPTALYIDFEMGESAMQYRLKAMGDVTDLDNFYIKSMYGWNMMDVAYQEALENVIKQYGLKIIAFDPLGNLWGGDENKREQVKLLTDYFDMLMGTYGVSICLTHHWRKATREFREGGEMAAGSYGWIKWLDTHVTLQGDVDSLVVSCDKNRNQYRWKRIRARMDTDTFLFEYLGDFENKIKFEDEDLVNIFRSFGKSEVTKPEFIAKGKEVCSRTTLYRLLDESDRIVVDDKVKPHILTIKPEQLEVVSWEGENE